MFSSIGVFSFGVFVISNLPSDTTSHAHPLANCVSAAFVNSALKFSNVPKSFWIASFISFGISVSFFSRLKNNEWFKICAPLLITGVLISSGISLMFVINSVIDFSCRVG